jgi:GNAT superfamily N-acetyltransferase
VTHGVTYTFERHPRSFVVNAMNDQGECVGWVNGQAIRGRRCVTVWEVQVHPDYRRRGIARNMMYALHKALPERTIIHDFVLSPEGLALAESLPRRWNRVEIDAETAVALRAELGCS